MDLGIAGKTAFVGASSDGLGKAVAKALVQEGVNVIINGRDAEKLENVLQELSALGQGSVTAIQADLANKEEAENLISEASSKFGRIDILITNTGGPPTGEFETHSDEEWENTYQLLLGSAVRIIRAFLPGMKERRWGRVITITSQAVKQPVDGLILSNSVRASIVGLVKTLSNEVGPHGVTVNNLMPGFTQTTRLKNLIEAKPEFADVTNEIPLRRFAKPEEFADAAVFLASERASYITGVSLPVDGGWIKSIM